MKVTIMSRAADEVMSRAVGHPLGEPATLAERQEYWRQQGERLRQAMQLQPEPREPQSRDDTGPRLHQTMRG